MYTPLSPPSHLDSSLNTSSASLVPSLSPYPPPSAMYSPSPLSTHQPTYELIPHRIFVGGFPSATTENELRTFFEKYGHIREAKVIRSTEGSSKGYGFVTFDTEEEASAVRCLNPDQLEFKGRRLNLGPALRRVSHSARFTDFAVASPTLPLYASPTYGSYHCAAQSYPSTPAYYVVQNQMPSFMYSPVSPQQHLQQHNPMQQQQQAMQQTPPYAPPQQQAAYAQQTAAPLQYYTHGQTDMTHYSQMAVPAYYYAPTTTMHEQQQQQHCMEDMERESVANVRAWLDRSEPKQKDRSEPKQKKPQKQPEAGTPVAAPPPSADPDVTPKAKPKAMRPRRVTKECPADPLTPEKLRLQELDQKEKVMKKQIEEAFQKQMEEALQKELEDSCPQMKVVRFYRVPFGGNRGKSVSLPSTPTMVLSPSSPVKEVNVVADLNRPQQRIASPRKSVVSLAAQMAQITMNKSPNVQQQQPQYALKGYGAQQAMTPPGVQQQRQGGGGGYKVALASGGTAQLHVGAVVPSGMLNPTPPSTPDTHSPSY